MLNLGQYLELFKCDLHFSYLHQSMELLGYRGLLLLLLRIQIRFLFAMNVDTSEVLILLERCLILACAFPIVIFVR